MIVVIASSYNGEGKEKMMKTSTLLMILLQFSAVYRMDSTYTYIVEVINGSFKDTTLQIWFPDDTTDNFLYIQNAGYSSGKADIFHSLPDNCEDTRKQILESNEKYMYKDLISAVKKGFMILPLIANRYFRTPVLPLYWTFMLSGIIKESQSDDHQSPEKC
jgi:hypothetical protein